MVIADEKTNRFLVLLRWIRTLGAGQAPFEEFGISAAQLALLEWICASPGRSLQDAANGLKVTAPNVSVGVRRLEDAGLVIRNLDPDDKRAWRFMPSKAGHSLMLRVEKYRLQKASLVLGALSEAEQDSLLALLGKAFAGTEDRSLKTEMANKASPGAMPGKNSKENQR